MHLPLNLVTVRHYSHAFYSSAVRLLWVRKDFPGAPAARQSASAVAISNTHALLFGGMTVAGKMANDLFMLTPLFDSADGVIEPEWI